MDHIYIYRSGITTMWRWTGEQLNTLKLSFPSLKRTKEKPFEVKTIIEAIKLIPQAKLSDLIQWGYTGVSLAHYFLIVSKCVSA